MIDLEETIKRGKLVLQVEYSLSDIDSFLEERNTVDEIMKAFVENNKKKYSYYIESDLTKSKYNFTVKCYSQD